MFSRSSSSSPDILQPPGDADYLISSPIKPLFPGRQSFMMSPANFRLLTPGPAKGKRPRVSLSPTKSTHSIRFDDVLLPASPNMKLNRRGRSISPDKTQPDGNTSPWRIRVTLEATQDDEENQGSPSRKRLKPSTVTTKVPLKGEPDQTPRRRRGRPRKSDIVDIPPNTGSPGNTPGPGGASDQKRKRGRPRKSLPEPEAITDGEGIQAEVQEEVVEPVTTTLEPEGGWSPLNLAGDADSDDGFQDDHTFLTDPFQEGNQTNGQDFDGGFAPTYDTPNFEATDQFYLRNGGDELNSTPSKMPSPTHDTQIISPDNTLHAGRTPRPSRVYPTPTSSSLVDDEKQDQKKPAVPDSSSSFKTRENLAAKDPTDEHREFDSIMESEGFSMVSLDTLPSARQHGLNSDTKFAKNDLKPLIEREPSGVLKRKARSMVHHNAEQPAPSMYPDLGTLLEHSAANSEAEFATLPSSGRRATATTRISSPGELPDLVAESIQRRPVSRLARIIRAGLVFQGVLEHSTGKRGGNLQDRMFDINESRKRLELIFGDLDTESQRILRAGLGVGQEFAKSRQKTEIESVGQLGVEEEASPDSPAFEYRQVNASRTPRQELDGTVNHSSPSTEMKRRFEEWQRERDAVSREIQMANTSQVIVIESEASASSSPKSVENPYYHITGDSTSENQRLSEQYSDPVEVEEEQPIDTAVNDVDDLLDEGGEEGHEEGDEDEDDGYEDIWQQEARDPGKYSDHSSVAHSPQADVRSTLESSPWKGGSTPAQRPSGKTYSPEYWTDGQSKVPFLGQSRVRELREEEVDISALLRAENTPNRNRYYYGRSSPLSTANGRTPRPGPPSAISQNHGYLDEYELDQDVHLESSPHSNFGDETFQIDPTTRHETEMQRHAPDFEEDENLSISDAAAGEEQPVYGAPNPTPRRPDHASAENPGSSWFQRITNLTPGWLRAPAKNSIEQPQLSNEKGQDDDDDDEEEKEIPSYFGQPHMHEDSRSEITDEDGEEEEEEETRRTPQAAEPSEGERTASPSPKPTPVNNTSILQEEGLTAKATRRRPLPPASGYFSNDHYAFLRHLYRLAKVSPEQFPYYAVPGHSQIIGDWIWTSDGAYGIPVTELQFAIVHRFVRDLTSVDLKSGGTGQIGWTEADLHRRLISVIIGEQIRGEMKDNSLAERSRADLLRSRSATVKTWRR